jgi:NADH dehydrogenase
MTSVVIVGSGFTGFECARKLVRILGKHEAPVDVTMISPVDYMLYTPLLPDVAGGLVDARFVAIPLANALRGVQQIRGRVDGVDFDGHTVTFTDPEERARTLPWDRLVLTPGSVTKLFDVPGLAEHARGLTSTTTPAGQLLGGRSWSSARPTQGPSWPSSCGRWPIRPPNR